MPLPVSIQKVLELHNIQYEYIFTDSVEDDSITVFHPEPADSERVDIILMQDTIGKLQAMINHDQILDLSKLCENLGRNLQALSDDEKEKIAHSHGVQKVPAIPHLTGYATVMDKSLLNKPLLYLTAGLPGVYVKVSQDQFKLITSDTDVCDYCHPICNYMPDITSNQSDNNMISTAVEQFTILRIKQRLESTLEIPPMPDTAHKIIKLRVDPDAGVGELAQLVERDPSLAAQVVSWASSPYYAAPGKINSVHDAVVRVLGFDLVINLALGLTLGKTMELPKDKVQGDSSYWQKAVFCAAATEAVVRLIPSEHRPSPGLCYLAGLLHNFGYLILGYIFPPHLSLVNRFIEANPHVNHSVLENFLLGITREQINAWLMRTWNMPEEVITGIKFQAFADYNEEHYQYSNVLYIVNQILHAKQFETGPANQIPESLLNRLGLNLESIYNACNKVFEQLDDLRVMAKNLEAP